MNAPRRHAMIHLFEYSGEIYLPDLLTNLEAKYPGFTSDLKRGDIINNVSSDQYRSNGSYMVDLDDEKQPVLVERDFKYDDYGAPNDCFLALSEFPLDYWNISGMEINDRWVPANKNEFYWHDGDSTSVKIDFAKLNLQPVFKKLVNNFYYYIFEFQDEKYLLLAEKDKHIYTDRVSQLEIPSESCDDLMIIVKFLITDNDLSTNNVMSTFC